MHSQVVHDQYGLTFELVSELLHELEEGLLIIRSLDQLHVHRAKLLTDCTYQSD